MYLMQALQQAGIKPSRIINDGEFGHQWEFGPDIQVCDGADGGYVLYYNDVDLNINDSRDVITALRRLGV